MKKRGVKFEYEEERDRDLMRAYCEQLRRLYDEHGGVQLLDDVFRRLVRMPSSRFWVSETRAAVVVGAMCREADRVGGTPRRWETLRRMRTTKRRMYAEIYRRYRLRQQARPDLGIFQNVTYVVLQAAPEFYITPDSAKVIYYRAKNKYYKEQIMKLRR